MKNVILISLLLVGSLAHAETSPETYTVEGKVLNSKAEAVRYVMSLGRPVSIIHSRCEILTNKLTFKACPKVKKSKAAVFENEQFTSIGETK